MDPYLFLNWVKGIWILCDCFINIISYYQYLIKTLLNYLIEENYKPVIWKGSYPGAKKKSYIASDNKS